MSINLSDDKEYSNKLPTQHLNCSNCVFYKIPDVSERNYRYGNPKSRYQRILTWYIQIEKLRLQTFELIYSDNNCHLTQQIK